MKPYKGEITVSVDGFDTTDMSPKEAREFADPSSEARALALIERMKAENLARRAHTKEVLAMTDAFGSFDEAAA